MMEISIKKARKSEEIAQTSIIDVPPIPASSTQITSLDIVSTPAEIGLEDPIENDFGGGLDQDFDDGFDDHNKYSFIANSEDGMDDNSENGIQDFQSEEDIGITKSLQAMTIRSCNHD
jgi:hypothetical protein